MPELTRSLTHAFFHLHLFGKSLPPACYVLGTLLSTVLRHDEDKPSLPLIETGTGGQ